MSIPLWCSRSAIFSEFTPAEQKTHFNLVQRKFLAEIDNFYYMVELDEVRCKDDIECLVEALERFAKNFDIKAKEKLDFMGFDFYPFGMKGYSYRLSLPECYDILIRKSLPNPNTHRIWVQIRASFIWKYGVKECIDRSFNGLQRILGVTKIKVLSVQENRVDYCFHNNAIQNPEKFFDRPKLRKYCKTNSRIYELIGNPQNDWSLDYVSVGSRRSNKVFFRVYNKTREVVEMNYKSFFIQTWYEQKLINSYDKFCLEYAYLLKSYDVGILIGQIKWYLKFGKNEDLKVQLQELYNKYFVENSNSVRIRNSLKKSIDVFVETGDYVYLRQTVLNILPPVTVITNIEYETHRDFYRSFNKSLINLKDSGVKMGELLSRVYLIYECRKVFVDYLTSFGNIVSFVKDRTLSKADIVSIIADDKGILKKDVTSDMVSEYIDGFYLDFWKRVRRADWHTDYKPELMREYERKMDVNRVKRRLVSNIASISVYQNGENGNGLMSDIYDTFNTFNDNFMYDLSFVDLNTGEVPEIEYGDYSDRKSQINRRLRSIISSASPIADDN